jgi:hypothetical protein
MGAIAELPVVNDHLPLSGVLLAIEAEVLAGLDEDERRRLHDLLQRAVIAGADADAAGGR